ncbi:hypothetical protein CDG81_01200 [Actinopolyspora erythraea]|uniref:Uncharacterized protein n=1 Tax=Actinopolyspora erythraea TaxID=414996 RepID=A0A223RMP5_9ACTN|nr:hypothetical protein CDG81_01200 [Actinopolyspora erythraea]
MVFVAIGYVLVSRYGWRYLPSCFGAWTIALHSHLTDLEQVHRVAGSHGSFWTG